MEDFSQSSENQNSDSNADWKDQAQEISAGNQNSSGTELQLMCLIHTNNVLYSGK